MKINKRIVAAAVAVAVCGSALLGVGSCRRPASPPVEEPPATPTVRVTSSELFTGDLKRLEPHLGMTAGCVKLEPSGPPQYLRLETEVWQGGKVVKTKRHQCTLLDGPCEVSISFREEAGPAGRMRYRVVTVVASRTGSGSSFSYLDIPKHEGISTAKHLLGTVELTAGKSVPVWGWMVGEGAGSVNGTESFEDMARRVKWALVFKLRLVSEL